LTTWQLGDGLRCNFQGLPPDKPAKHVGWWKTSARDRQVLKGLPLLGLYADRDEIGPRVFLVLSWLFTNGGQTERAMHTQAILSQEQNPTHLVWGDFVRAYAQFTPIDCQIQFNISHSDIITMMPLLGVDEDSTLTVLTKFVPRRTPATIRKISDEHWQYWAPL